MNQPLPYEKHTKMLLGMKRYREALLVARKWVENQPDNGNAWFYLAFAQSNANLPAQALESINKSLELKPGNALVLAQKAQIVSMVGGTRECLEIIDDLLSRGDMPIGLKHQIGTTLNNIGEHLRAVELFEAVRGAEPDNAANLISLGTAYHILGKADEAIEAQTAAIVLQPEDFRSYWLLGQMQAAKPDDNHLDLFEGALAQNPDKLQARICLNFALAKQLEELGDFPGAFSHLEIGSEAVLEHTPYEEQKDEAARTAIKTHFNAEYFQTEQTGCDREEPIFILGMPRTGTTLLEQIVTTYDGIETAGELHHFPHLFNQACMKHRPEATDLDMAYADSNGIDWADLGRKYLDAARLHVGDSERFIDKYPLNFLMVGPILRALPHARIINLRRNPMDTCFSNYKLLYRLGTALHTYDLNTMARYYLRYREIMAHWHACLPGRILDVDYEDLVTSPEQTTKTVAGFLGLDWDPTCLDFYKSGSAVATASVTQVRKPINRGSLYKWKKFEPQLAPLSRFFQENGIEV